MTLLMGVCTTQELVAEKLYLKWTPDPKAHHYIGTYIENGVLKKFQTSSHWLLLRLDQKSHIKIVAVDEHDFYLSNVQYKQELIPTPIQKNQGDGQGSELKHKEAPVLDGSGEGSSDESNDTSRVGEASLQEQTYDDALLFLDVDDPFASPLVKKKAAQGLKPYERSSETLVAARLGIGQEKLDSVGGASLFAGVSSIGSTTLEVLGMSKKGFAFTLRTEAHAYETRETKKGTNDTLQNESFLRLTFDGRLGFEMLNRQGLALIPQIGYYSTGVPMLSQIDSDTGQAAFKLTRLGSLGVGLEIFGHPSKNHRLGAQVLYFPIAGPDDLKGYQVDVDYQYFLRDSWFIQASALRSLSQGKATGRCSEIDGCQELIKSTLTTRQLAAGAGYIW